MKLKPEEPSTIFRTDEGSFNVALFSPEGKLKFKLAQKALKELTELSDKVMILREAVQSLRAVIIDMECHEVTLIKEEE